MPPYPAGRPLMAEATFGQGPAAASVRVHRRLAVHSRRLIDIGAFTPPAPACREQVADRPLEENRCVVLIRQPSQPPTRPGAANGPT